MRRCSGFKCGGRPRSRVLHCWEQLEQRCLLAITVNTLVDEADGSIVDGDISLRDALATAVPGDTVNFDASLDGGTILLTLGELRVTRSLTIDATPLPLGITIDAQGASRALNIDDSDDATDSPVTLTRLVATRGSSISGGAIRSAETLYINSSTISGSCTLYGPGGGIWTSRNLTIVSSSITENRTEDFGSGGRDASGGGIWTSGDLVITNSTISGNSAGDYSNGGGGIYARGNVAITNSIISGNSTGVAYGGGGVRSLGMVTISNSTIGDNYAHVRGGGILADAVVITSSTISGNVAADDGLYAGSIGGGIYASSVTVIESTVSDNSALGIGGDIPVPTRGGGIYARGDVTIIKSTVSGNLASGDYGYGGGVSGSTVAVTDSNIAGNQSRGWARLAEGGGIQATDDLTVVSSTISGNGALGRFGASGGGIVGLREVTVILSTIVRNSAGAEFEQPGYSGGDGGGISSNSGPVTITNSIVAENSDDSFGGRTPDLKPGSSLLLVAFSLIGDNAGTNLDESPVGVPDVNGNLIGGPINGVIDPLLAPLADNGGPTYTHSLLSGSPAINAGDPLFTPPPDFDQRGMPYSRIVGGRIDMGASELEFPTVLSITRADSDPTNAAEVTFIALFSQEVTGVDASDFELAPLGSVSGSVSEVTPIAGNIYMVSVVGVAGAGTLRLDLIDDDSIVNSGADPLAGPGFGNGDFLGEQYSVDRVPPTVLTIVRTETTPTNAENVGFTVTFSEDVAGVDLSAFLLTTSGDASGTVSEVTPVSNSVYSVLVDAISGAGTLRLDLVDDDSIMDLLNPLGGVGIGNGDFAGEAYTVDRIVPVVESIVRVGPDPVVTEEAQFTVVFSEDVSGVDADDFMSVSSGSATGVLSEVAPLSETTYVVTVEAINGVGTLRLDVVDDDTITDTVGNTLGGSGAGNGNFSGETYDVFVPVLRYAVPPGSGPQDLTLRLNGDVFEIVDPSEVVRASLPLTDTQSVVVSGSDGESDRLTVDFDFGGFFTVAEGISFEGGTDGNDALRILGNGLTAGTYLPSGTTIGSGMVSITSGADTVVVTFSGLEPVEISGMTELAVVTPNGGDSVSVGNGTGSGGEPASVVTGSSGGVAFESLTFYDVDAIRLDLGTNDQPGSESDTVAITADPAARNLADLTVSTGVGIDIVNTSSVDISLPGTLQLAGTNPKLALSGNVVEVGSLDAASTTLSGFGVIVADSVAYGSLAPSGGNVTRPGLFDLGTRDGVVLSSGFANLGSFVTLDGGTVQAANGLLIAGGSTLEGHGVLSGRVSAAPGSTISATGNFSLGTDAAFDGFAGFGTLTVGNHTVTIHDRNAAILGTLTEIGSILGPGTLASTNGLLLPVGSTLVGFGLVSGSLDNQAVVVGEGMAIGDRLELDGNVSGPGAFVGEIAFSGTYSPTAALIPFDGNVEWASGATLRLNLNGVQAGSGYPRLDVTGNAFLAGTLQVVLGFSPQVGNEFRILTFGSGTGDFSAFSGLDVGNGLKLVPRRSETDYVLRTESFIPGDSDRDGNIDFDDIDDFVLGLNNPAAYEAIYGVPPATNGDMDGDGDQDFDDIAAFVAALTSGEQSASSATFALAPETDGSSPLIANGAGGQASQVINNVPQSGPWQLVRKREATGELWSPRSRWTTRHSLPDEFRMNDEFVLSLPHRRW